MNAIDPPESGQKVSSLWKVVAQLVKVVNAMASAKIVRGNTDKWEVIDSSATFTLAGGTDGANGEDDDDDDDDDVECNALGPVVLDAVVDGYVVQFNVNAEQIF